MMVAAYLLATFAALDIAARASGGRWLPLLFALLTLGWIVGQFNPLIEAVVFGVMPLGTAAPIAAVSLGVYAVLAALAVTTAWRWGGRTKWGPKPRITLVRLLAIIVGYEVLYWSAGTLVFPFVQDFYEARTLPPAWQVAALQIPRALIFVVAAWPWLSMRPKQAPLVLAIAFSVIGGIAPLFPDNPYMPANIRLAHGFEVGISNFLFGLWVGWLLKPAPKQGF